ncbi:MAG: beta-lactamase family protein [Alphaproteobacteria bacterium]|nr:beta-lactamase family protein [Alphaproteobacteria bacterium]
MRLLNLLTPALAFLFTLTASAEEPQFDPGELSSYMEGEIRSGRVPGAAIAVVRGSEVIYAAGFGATQAGGEEQLTPRHAFRSASTLKMMVGLALVRLHEQGRLDLHAPISNYLSGLDPAISHITTHQLLNHISGILDTSVEHTTPHDMTLAEYARSLDNSFVYVSPGASFSYSNPGYALAGAVLEAVTEMPFEEAMADLLFEPLQMNRSTFSLSRAQDIGLAIGHRDQDGNLEVVPPAENGLSARPSGTLFSTVLDYANFLVAFLDGGQFQEAEIWGEGAASMMNTPQIPPAQLVTSYSYSYGLMIGQFHGQPALFHTGGMPGYASNVLILPELDLGVVLFSNGEALDRMHVLYLIASQFAELETAEQRPGPEGLEPLAREAAADLLGVYLQRDDLPTIRIFEQGEDIFLLNRGVRYRLHHEGGEFYIGISDTGRWFRFRIATTPDGRYRFVQWWIRSFARPLSAEH